MRNLGIAKAGASLLTKTLAENDSHQVWLALKQLLKGQNVSEIARSAGMRRDTLYRSFSGKVDPSLSRVLKLLKAINIRLVAIPSGQGAGRLRSKLAWIYVDARKQIDDPDHLKVFASEEAANRWIAEHDPEGVAFEYRVIE
jgi:probable addiction module antidote protein